MATMKDVAAAAGVSLGTVSNVLNGKTQNAELIERVEKVVKELGFKPDAKARSLKSSQTNLIGLLVSTLSDRNIQLMNAAIEKNLNAYGYHCIVKTTENNEILEQKYIEYFIQMGVDGIIVNTSVKKKNWMKLIKKNNIPVIFTNKLIDLETNMDIIKLNYDKAFQECFDWLNKQQVKTVGLILENGMIDEDDLRKLRMHNTEVIYRIVGDNSAESGFKAAYEMLYEKSVDALILGSYQLSQGAGRAVEIFEEKIGSMLKICIKTENWIEDDAVFDALVEVSNYEIGCLATNRIVEKISLSNKNRTSIVTVNAVFRQKNKGIYNGSNCSLSDSNVLNIGILNAETAEVLKKLSIIYEREKGIRLQFHRMKYRELWKLVYDKEHLKNSNIDVIMYDVIWKEDLIKLGVLEDISGILETNPEHFEDYIDRIVHLYGQYEEKLYGLPFLTGTQLLFYQKDLFEDQLIKRSFSRQFGYELKPPANWNEYNDIARFFTKAYTPTSPVEYGTAMISKGNLYNSIEFLNRLWSFGGNVVENNKIDWDQAVMRIAMEDYKTSAQYRKTDIITESWKDVAELFMTGDTAMAILYDSYAFGINDSMRSKVAGNIGSCMIPGGCPVLGGWGLAISIFSNLKGLAADFIMWACGENISQPFAVLSGISSRKSFYLNRDLDGLYPWKSNILESYAQSRIRSLLNGCNTLDANLLLYDEILGSTLGRYIRDEIDIDEAIKYMEERTQELLK